MMSQGVKSASGALPINSLTASPPKATPSVSNLTEIKRLFLDDAMQPMDNNDFKTSSPIDDLPQQQTTHHNFAIKLLDSPSDLIAVSVSAKKNEHEITSKKAKKSLQAVNQNIYLPTDPTLTPKNDGLPAENLPLPPTPHKTFLELDIEDLNIKLSGSPDSEDTFKCVRKCSRSLFIMASKRPTSTLNEQVDHLFDVYKNKSLSPEKFLRFIETFEDLKFEDSSLNYLMDARKKIINYLIENYVGQFLKQELNNAFKCSQVLIYLYKRADKKVLSTVFLSLQQQILRLDPTEHNKLVDDIKKTSKENFTKEQKNSHSMLIRFFDKHNLLKQDILCLNTNDNMKKKSAQFLNLIDSIKSIQKIEANFGITSTESLTGFLTFNTSDGIKNIIDSFFSYDKKNNELSIVMQTILDSIKPQNSDIEQISAISYIVNALKKRAQTSLGKAYAETPFVTILDGVEIFIKKFYTQNEQGEFALVVSEQVTKNIAEELKTINFLFKVSEGKSNVDGLFNKTGMPMIFLYNLLTDLGPFTSEMQKNPDITSNHPEDISVAILYNVACFALAGPLFGQWQQGGSGVSADIKDQINLANKTLEKLMHLQQKEAENTSITNKKFSQHVLYSMKKNKAKNSQYFSSLKTFWLKKTNRRLDPNDHKLLSFDLKGFLDGSLNFIDDIDGRVFLKNLMSKMKNTEGVCAELSILKSIFIKKYGDAGDRQFKEFINKLVFKHKNFRGTLLQHIIHKIGEKYISKDHLLSSVKFTHFGEMKTVFDNWELPDSFDETNKSDDYMQTHFQELSYYQKVTTDEKGHAYDKIYNYFHTIIMDAPKDFWIDRKKSSLAIHRLLLIALKNEHITKEEKQSLVELVNDASLRQERGTMAGDMRFRRKIFYYKTAIATVGYQFYTARRYNTPDTETASMANHALIPFGWTGSAQIGPLLEYFNTTNTTQYSSMKSFAFLIGCYVADARYQPHTPPPKLNNFPSKFNSKDFGLLRLVEKQILPKLSQQNEKVLIELNTNALIKLSKVNSEGLRFTIEKALSLLDLEKNVRLGQNAEDDARLINKKDTILKKNQDILPSLNSMQLLRLSKEILALLNKESLLKLSQIIFSELNKDDLLSIKQEALKHMEEIPDTLAEIKSATEILREKQQHLTTASNVEVITTFVNAVYDFKTKLQTETRVIQTAIQFLSFQTLFYTPFGKHTLENLLYELNRRNLLIPVLEGHHQEDQPLLCKLLENLEAKDSLILLQLYNDKANVNTIANLTDSAFDDSEKFTTFLSIEIDKVTTVDKAMLLILRATAFLLDPKVDDKARISCAQILMSAIHNAYEDQNSPFRILTRRSKEKILGYKGLYRGFFAANWGVTQSFLTLKTVLTTLPLMATGPVGIVAICAILFGVCAVRLIAYSTSDWWEHTSDNENFKKAKKLTDDILKNADIKNIKIDKRKTSRKLLENINNDMTKDMKSHVMRNLTDFNEKLSAGIIILCHDRDIDLAKINAIDKKPTEEQKIETLDFYIKGILKQGFANKLNMRVCDARIIRIISKSNISEMNKICLLISLFHSVHSGEGAHGVLKLENSYLRSKRYLLPVTLGGFAAGGSQSTIVLGAANVMSVLTSVGSEALQILWATLGDCISTVGNSGYFTKRSHVGNTKSFQVILKLIKKSLIFVKRDYKRELDLLKESEKPPYSESWSRTNQLINKVLNTHTGRKGTRWGETESSQLDKTVPNSIGLTC